MSKDVSARLKNYFADQGISQQKIADDLGVSHAYVNQILNGTKSIGKQTAARISNLYGISKGWLLSGEGDMLVSGDASAQVNGNGNAVNNVTGNGNKVSAQVAGDFAELASKFSESLLLAQRQLSSSQSQIDRLISVLEKLTGAGGGR